MGWDGFRDRDTHTKAGVGKGGGRIWAARDGTGRGHDSLSLSLSVSLFSPGLVSRRIAILIFDIFAVWYFAVLACVCLKFSLRRLLRLGRKREFRVGVVRWSWSWCSCFQRVIHRLGLGLGGREMGSAVLEGAWGLGVFLVVPYLSPVRKNRVDTWRIVYCLVVLLPAVLLLLVSYGAGTFMKWG